MFEASMSAISGTFKRLGLTDTALLMISEETALLTADLHLYLTVLHAGRNAVNFNHLREQRS